MPKYIRPVSSGWISATFKQHKGRTPPSVEPGIDYAVPRGTPVVAPAAGVIRLVDMGTGGHDGRRVMIEFDTVAWGSGIHLNSGAPVRVGQRVSQGQTIAFSGASRRGMDVDSSTGAHLHWTFWENPKGMPVPGSTRPDDFEAYLASPAKTGSGTAAVRGIQTALNTLKYGLTVDGIRGPKTIDAIKRFQTSQGLVPDGVWGPLTNSAYNRIVVSRRGTVKQGSKGNLVKLVQRKVGVVQDGVFGPKTRAAVVAFQIRNRLTPDGIVGRKTWQKLGY